MAADCEDGILELREVIGLVGRDYDKADDFQSAPQVTLRAAKLEFLQWLPVGYKPVGSGGQGSPASVPWIAVLNEDETSSAQRGMYVVYLFAEDRKTVYLSLNQGVTELVGSMGRPLARTKLRGQADAIRAAFDPADVIDLAGSIDLKSTQQLPRDYEFGNIVSLVYDATGLPSEAVMVADLGRMVRLYDVALQLREEARLAQDGTIVTPIVQPKPTQHAAEFKPRDDSDYKQQIVAREITKSRRHETLVTAYGKFLQSKGFTVATNVHPRDMTAERDGEHWLIEAKTLYAGNGVSAARDAVGQLTFYNFAWYNNASPANLMALFNEAVGPHCIRYLDFLGIAAVWRDKGKWVGNFIATGAGLAETDGC